jgi:hypothetical protein
LFADYIPSVCPIKLVNPTCSSEEARNVTHAVVDAFKQDPNTGVFCSAVVFVSLFLKEVPEGG